MEEENARINLLIQQKFLFIFTLNCATEKAEFNIENESIHFNWKEQGLEDS